MAAVSGRLGKINRYDGSGETRLANVQTKTINTNARRFSYFVPSVRVTPLSSSGLSLRRLLSLIYVYLVRRPTHAHFVSETDRRRYATTQFVARMVDWPRRIVFIRVLNGVLTAGIREPPPENF